MKILYPDINVSVMIFEKYCVDTGKELRGLFREQMALKNSECKEEIAEIVVK